MIIPQLLTNIVRSCNCQPLRVFTKYAFETFVQVEMAFGRELACTTSNVTTVYSDNGLSCPIDSDVLLKGAGIDSSISILGNVGVLLLFIMITRILGYFSLKLRHTNHKPRLSH